ncbi:MAG: hypothetical protein U0869_19610 [Chloroflexota bacterium]
MRFRSARTFLATGVLAAGLLLPGASASAAPLAMPFIAQVNGCAVSGSGVAPGQIVHRSAAGAKKGTYTPQVSGLSWYASCTKSVIVPGDTLTFLDLSGGTPVVIQKVTIPAFTAVLDRRLQRVTGLAKGVKKVDLQLQQCKYQMSVACDVKDDGSVPVSAGAYLYAPAKPVTGTWQVALQRSNGGLTLAMFAGFPRLVASLGSAAITGVGNPDQSISVRVDRAGQAATLSGRVGKNRGWDGTVKRNTAARALAVGDRIRWYLAGKLQADFVVPAIDMTIAPSHTSGHCFPGGSVRITATKPDKSQSLTNGGPVNQSGAFDVTMSISSGWSVELECRTPSGDGITISGVAGV